MKIYDCRVSRPMEDGHKTLKQVVAKTQADAERHLLKQGYKIIDITLRGNYY